MSNQKLIEAVTPVALATAFQIRDHHIAHGGPLESFYHWNNDYTAAMSGPGRITFRGAGNPAAEVIIHDVRVAEVNPRDIWVGPIEPVGEQRVVRATVMGTRNRTNEDIPRRVTITDVTAESMTDDVAQEVGVGVAMEFRQLVSYGGELYGVGGETEITASVSAEYKKAWSQSRTKSSEFTLESEREFVEKAGMRTVFDRLQQVGPARQVTRVKGRLEFAVSVHAPGVWWHAWPSRQAMLASWKGIESAEKEANFWLDFYRQHPVPGADGHEAFADVYAEVEHVREFEEVGSVEVDIYNEALSEQVAFREALLLVSRMATNEQLRELAVLEMG